MPRAWPCWTPCAALLDLWCTSQVYNKQWLQALLAPATTPGPSPALPLLCSPHPGPQPPNNSPAAIRARILGRATSQKARTMARRQEGPEEPSQGGGATGGGAHPGQQPKAAWAQLPPLVLLGALQCAVTPPALVSYDADGNTVGVRGPIRPGEVYYQAAPHGAQVVHTSPPHGSTWVHMGPHGSINPKATIKHKLKPETEAKPRVT